MKHFLYFLLIFTASLQAQTTVKGIVKSGKTGKALPFASIQSEGNSIADVDGKFSIETTSSSITVSYTGFIPLTIPLTENKAFYTVILQPHIVVLDEVKIENPANAIVRAAIRLKKKNDPRKALSSFKFKSYNKLIVTANPDSIKGTIDSQAKRKRGKVSIEPDSSNYKLKKLVAKRHLFQTEKISQIQFNRQGFKETVLGTKMAGFDKPVYELVSLQQQSFSIYDNRYELFETAYRSPIADVGPARYFYKLLDTVFIQGRKAYVIYFRPKNTSKKSPGLQGLLYIDCEHYAVAKAVIRIKSVLDITAVHENEFIAGEKLWFPTGRELKIIKGTNKDDIKIFGETLTFDGSEPESISQRAKQSSDYIYFLSKSHYFDKEYNVAFDIKNPSVAIEIKESAISRDDVFWNKYRDSTDQRSAETYRALDSISKKRKIEGKLRIGRKLLNGYFPVGPIDLDLRYILSYNNYEGFRLGIGGITNDKLSEKYRIEGYTAYGTKDGEFKYNLGGAARFGKFSSSWIGGSYTDDVREIASTSFAIDRRVFKVYDPRPINVSTFYNYKNWRGYIETKLIPKTESIWQLMHSDINPLFNYTFIANGKPYHKFTMSTAMVSIQWNPFSDYMQTPAGRIETDKRFPKFTFQFTQSLRGVAGNDFDFNKLDLRGEYEIRYLDGEKSSFLVEAGYANGDVPITHLYNTSPNNLTKDRLIQRITFAGKNSFETMYFNEFFSSRYVIFQLKHGLKRIALFKKVRPSLVFVTRMAWGDMDHPEQHFGISYKTLEDGFFESGLELNKIFKGLGLTGFYRYGPNQLPRFEDNLAVKLNFVLDLGI